MDHTFIGKAETSPSVIQFPEPKALIGGKSFVTKSGDKSAAQGIEGNGVSRRLIRPQAYRPSYSVKQSGLIRTARGHGLSADELRRISGVFQVWRDFRMLDHLIWAVVGDALLDMDPAEAVAMIDEVRRRISMAQKRADLPGHWLQVTEVTGGLHANLVFLGTPAMGQSLRDSFPDVFRRDDAIQPVTNAKDLQGYLGKECTQQAAHAMHLPAAGKGRFRSPIGGDRVRLSRQLQQDGIEAGRIEPWAKTNSRRKPAEEDRRAGHSGRRRALPKPKCELRESGQLAMFPALEKPVVRLHDYRGGLMPATVAMEIEHRRKAMGITQEELARRAMISRPQLANACRGHDGLSAWAVNRLRDVLLVTDIDQLSAA